MVGKVDAEHNCHNLVPLLAMAEVELVDLQARSDRTSLSPDELAKSIEDPYRKILYSVGRKVC